MLFLPEAAGPHDPATSTPLRLPGSVRRTSSIDITRPDGLAGVLVVDARARDVHTGPDGSVSVRGEATLRARVDGTTRRLTSLDTSPARPELDRLKGALVGRGFRSRVEEIVPHERDVGTLLHLLLDDLPGAALVSGYAMLRGGAFDGPGGGGERHPPDTGRLEDLCAGWARDGSMLVAFRSEGALPVPAGPPAPVLELAGDQLSWHAMDRLPPHGVRRRRRLDVLEPELPGGPYRLDAHFRDSHVDDGGAESVVHEYSVSGHVDRTTRVVVDIAARARVLPWLECPAAVTSAGRLAGRRLEELRPWVRRELTGVSTCTHLNDTLRSLADAAALLAVLDREPA